MSRDDPVALLRDLMAITVASIGYRAHQAGEGACWASDGLTPYGRLLCDEGAAVLRSLTDAGHYFGVRLCAPTDSGGCPPDLPEWTWRLMLRALTLGAQEE